MTHSHTAATLSYRKPEALRPHPEAGLIPSTPEELNALRQDIGLRGILHPLDVTADNQILDGITRWQIGTELALSTVPVQIFKYPNPLDAAAHAIRVNLKRRHLSVPQKLTLANRLLVIERKLAAERKKATAFAGRTRKGTPARANDAKLVTPRKDAISSVRPKLAPTEDQRKRDDGKAIGRVAKEVGLSRTTLQKAQTAIKANPALEAPLLKGAISVDAAYNSTRSPMARKGNNGQLILPAMPHWTPDRITYTLARLIGWIDDWNSILPTIARSQLKLLCEDFGGVAARLTLLANTAIAQYKKGGRA